jgi:cytochrome c oxidase assembly factor CtaG/putative copper export protein
MLENQESRPPAPGGTLRLGLGMATAALVVLAITLRFGGALKATFLPEDATTPELEQAGAYLKGLLPAVELAVNAAGTITVGLLLVVVVFLPAEDGRLSKLAERCVRAASVSAVCWSLAALTVAVMSVADLYGMPLVEALSGPELASYLTEVSQGRGLLLVAVITAVLSVAVHRPRTPGGAGYLLILALVALLPPAFTGHAASASSHSLAAYSLIAHILGSVLWIGGLLVLVAVAWPLGDQLGEVVARYSRLALLCYAVVGVSGLVNAWIRLDGPHLGSRYGVLVVAKAVALVGLGALGWWHRKVSIPALRSERRTGTFVRIAALELVAMAATVALAIGLSRTAPPAGEPGQVGPQEAMLGFELPGPAGLPSYLFDWWIDPLFIVLVLAGAGLYGAAVIRLHRENRAWPRSRTIAWFTGLLIMLIATCSGLARYSMVLTSAHIVQHLALTMLAPIMLLLGAPLTLALRTLRPRRDVPGRTPPELLLAVVHSRAAKFLTHPLVALAVLIAGLYGFYYSPLFEASLWDHSLHSLMMLLFVIVGVLYLWPIVGLGTGPHRLAPVMRFALILAAIPIHAFFGIAFMMSTDVFAGGWYRALGRPWGTSQLHDQQTGGWLALSLAGVATLLVILALVRQRAHGYLKDAPPPDHYVDLLSEDDGLAHLDVHLSPDAADLASEEKTCFRRGSPL